MDCSYRQSYRTAMSAVARKRICIAENGPGDIFLAIQPARGCFETPFQGWQYGQLFKLSFSKKKSYRYGITNNIYYVLFNISYLFLILISYSSIIWSVQKLECVFLVSRWSLKGANYNIINRYRSVWAMKHLWRTEPFAVKSIWFDIFSNST